MSKISKNIKQLRTERGMSQNELAEKLFVTRQAISSWENGRTQPDIQMLGKLRVIFDVSIEELLYGKKRNTELELKKPSYRGTLVTVFSVLGSLLVAVGLILIFVVLLDDMPDFILETLAFLPFIIGTGIGTFVYTKKKERKSWCEAAGILWSLGSVATFALVNGRYEIILSGSLFYLSLSLILMLIMFLLKSVAVLPFMYVTGILSALTAMEGINWDAPMWERVAARVLSILIGAVIFALGIYFRKLLLKADKESHRVGIAEWLTAIAVPAFLIFDLMDFSEGFSVVAVLSFTGLVYFILSQKDNESTSPYILGFVLLCGMISFFGIISYDMDYIFYGDYSDIIVVSLLGIIALAVALIYIKGKFQSKLGLALGGVYLLSHIGFTAMVFYCFWEDELMDKGLYLYTNTPIWVTNLYSIVMPMLALVFFAILIGEGAVRKKLIPMNIGFAGFVIQVMFWVGASGLGMLTNGIVLLLCGIVLLLINLKISKMKEETVTIVVETYDYDDEE